MPSIDDMVSNVFLRLGDPRANRPGYLQALNQVCTQLRTVLRFKRNTSNPWNFDETVIDVVPDVESYTITAANFGTPLSVITYAPQVATWIARPVQIVEPQNMEYDYGLPRNFGAWNWPADGSNCNAMRCCFTWTNNIPTIRLLPLPYLVCQYKIKFLQNAAGVYTDALATSPVFSDDCDLVEVRSALALLSLTEWNDPSSKDGRAYNGERRRDLAQTLQGEEAELRRQFEAASLTPHGPRIYDRYSGMMSE